MKPLFTKEDFWFDDEDGANRANAKVSALVTENEALKAQVDDLRHVENLKHDIVVGLAGKLVLERDHYKRLLNEVVSEFSLKGVHFGFLSQAQEKLLAEIQSVLNPTDAKETKE